MLISLLLSIFLALSPISLQIYPQVSQAPSDIRVTLSIPPNPDNIQYCITLDGGDYQSSCVELLGDREPVTKQIWFKSLSSGEYVIVAELLRHNGDRFSARSQFTIN